MKSSVLGVHLVRRLALRRAVPLFCLLIAASLLLWVLIVLVYTSPLPDLRYLIAAALVALLGAIPWAARRVKEERTRVTHHPGSQALDSELASSAGARVDAQEDERRRLARELHDGLGQVLTAIKFSIEILEDAPNLTAQDRERLSDIRAQLEAAMKEVREISSNLMPSVLEDFGLSPALESLCHQTAKSTGLTVRFQTQGVVERLPSSVETGLYRIAQEALTNAAKHAEATEVEVQLFTRDRSLWLTVEDDGKGFDVEGGNVRRTTPGRIGLVSMKERVAALGGILTIETRPGAGTEILVELPLPEGE